jgi:hypothetical protein
VSTDAFLGRYFGWAVTRIELAIATLLPVLGSVVGVAVAEPYVILLGAWIPMIGVGLVLWGGIGALRGTDPAEWLRTVGVGYVFLGTMNAVATGFLILAFWSGFETRIAVALVASGALATVFLGRGGWFLTVTERGTV